MKKIATFLAIAAMFTSQGAFAQNPGSGAAAGRTYSSNYSAWGIGIGMMAVVGTIIGVTTCAATDNGSSFSH